MGDEFEDIETLFRPLAAGAPEALDLRDDVAVIPSRPGHDLVITKDAMVAGVHFLSGDPPDLVARKLLRVNLSDLAAKGAAPFGYFLSVHWPPGFAAPNRRLFADGLAEDQARYGLRLLGGDTVSTSGPLTVTATMLGWIESGRVVRRSGARPGQLVLVSGTIGDGGLGLMAARGELTVLAVHDREALAARYRLPEPRTAIPGVLRDCATAAADVSDGLLADAGHVAAASGVAIEIDLDRLPLSGPAQAWLQSQPDSAAALAILATAGDDYEIVCAAWPTEVERLIAASARAGVAMTAIGRVVEGAGVFPFCQGEPVSVARMGWRHV
jgi:thiamine-monophosphate kinase